uniref:Uncharacterized protein n=1 Tax=Arundo donax TaxID=35708 RepID=A0A0A9B579_ARUDO
MLLALATLQLQPRTVLSYSLSSPYSKCGYLTLQEQMKVL